MNERIAEEVTTEMFKMYMISGSKCLPQQERLTSFILVTCLLIGKTTVRRLILSFHCF